MILEKLFNTAKDLGELEKKIKKQEEFIERLYETIRLNEEVACYYLGGRHERDYDNHDSILSKIDALAEKMGYVFETQKGKEKLVLKKKSNKKKSNKKKSNNSKK